MDASHDLFGRKSMSFCRGFYSGHSQESVIAAPPLPIPALSFSYFITPVKEAFDRRWQRPSTVTQLEGEL